MVLVGIVPRTAVVVTAAHPDTPTVVHTAPAVFRRVVTGAARNSIPAAVRAVVAVPGGMERMGVAVEEDRRHKAIIREEVRPIICMMKLIKLPGTVMTERS